MKYICDILLNFCDDTIYDFFEWHPDDNIEYFKKVPIIRLSEDLYSMIMIGSKVKNEEFLNKIYNTTEIYQDKMIRHVDYACIMAHDKEAIAVLFNKKGEIIMMSKMLIDEEEEAIDISGSIPELKLSIDISKAKYINKQFLTRLEDHKNFFLNKEINDLYENNNLIKLKYLYYECFNQLEDNINLIYKKIKAFLNEEWTNKHDNLYNLVRLSYSKK